MRKRAIVQKIVLAAALFCSVSSIPSFAATDHIDVKSTDWFYPAVSAMSEKNIISGNPDGTFKPEDTVTYGDFITMAVKASTGKELPAAAAPLHWSAGYYDLALANKYFSKNDIPASALGEPISRAYMALICSNILGDSVEVKGEYFSLLESSVSDITADTKYEYEIIRSYGAGILSGYTDGTFRPKATLQRAEAASVIWHLADESRRNAPNIDDLRAKAQQEQKDNRTQEQRIQDILHNGPQKISFDPATDETKDRDGRTVMKEEKAREYLDQILATLKFYGSNGKYYMTVTFPEVPKGYQVHFGANIAYKQALMKPQWLAKTGAVDSENNIARIGTITKEIKGMLSLSQIYTVHIGMSINKIDDTYFGSEEASYEVQRDYDGAIEDHFAINRQDSATDVTENYPYKLDRHFNWK